MPTNKNKRRLIEFKVKLELGKILNGREFQLHHFFCVACFHCVHLLRSFVPGESWRSPQTGPAGRARSSSSSGRRSPPPPLWSNPELCPPLLEGSSRSPGGDSQTVNDASFCSEPFGPCVSGFMFLFTSKNLPWQCSTLEISLEKAQTASSVSFSAAVWREMKEREVTLKK